MMYILYFLDFHVSLETIVKVLRRTRGRVSESEWRSEPVFDEFYNNKYIGIS